MRVICPHCKKVQAINRLEMRMAATTRRQHHCQGCGRRFLPDTKPASRSVDVLRSCIQEKNAARRYDAFRQKASGALPGMKGDVRLPGKLRLECKFTGKQSYTLKLKDLSDLESYAAAGEDPIFEIEFQAAHPAKRYVVMPEWLYLHYRALMEA